MLPAGPLGGLTGAGLGRLCCGVSGLAVEPFAATASIPIAAMGAGMGFPGRAGGACRHVWVGVEVWVSLDSGHGWLEVGSRLNLLFIVCPAFPRTVFMSIIKPFRHLDCGDGARLELVGPHRLVRPVPTAFWSPGLDRREWAQAEARYIRSSTGGGDWDHLDRLPEAWTVAYAGLNWWIKPTGFGHLGLFPEQAENWAWLRQRVAALGGAEARVLNLFAYTGGSTLCCAQAGGEVTHVDASRGIVSWARENSALNGLEGAPIRWIVDDVLKFTRREIRRGVKYRGVILDPPTFGRGSKGEVWKIETDLPALLGDCLSLLADGPAFILLSCHSPGFTPLILQEVLRGTMRRAGGQYEAGEMVVSADADGGVSLPTGTWVRWWRAD
jgi:23S rRNA (cytosine1962-C5)-methyltransferase